MLRLLWYILVAFALSLAVSWLLDNDGKVLITWLNYEVRTGVFAAILMTIFFTLTIFVISYLLARILAIRFPKFSELFFKKSHLKKLEKLISKNDEILDVTSQLLMALEIGDKKLSKKLQKTLSKLDENSQINNFLFGKIAFDNNDYSKAEECFSKLNDSKNKEFLILKTKFKLALEKDDETSAISYAKEILAIRKDSKISNILNSLNNNQKQQTND